MPQVQSQRHRRVSASAVAGVLLVLAVSRVVSQVPDFRPPVEDMGFRAPAHVLRSVPELPLPLPMLSQAAAAAGKNGPETPLIHPPGLEAPPSAEPTPPPPSQNATINLINRLVQKGVLTQAEAAELIQQAEADAVLAQEQSAMPAGGEDAVRVTYVPEVVKAEIRDQLKMEVMEQARAENWAAPRKFPDWTERIKFFGDIRVRYEGLYFPEGNDNTGSFPNFNAINTGPPFDVSGTVFSPQHNVDQQRERLRLRVRLGADIDLQSGWTAGLRLATGDSSTPVSANQTFGVANQGQGGNFSKYAVWLDRGFIKYDLVCMSPEESLPGSPVTDAKGVTRVGSPRVVPSRPVGNVSLMFGRFDNPFFNASEIMWDEDLGFDGLALHARGEIFRGVTPFLSAGMFPIFNTDLNFSSNQPAKFESTDKWLYAVQGGVDLKFGRSVNTKLGVGYFNFDGVEGRESDPYIPLTTSDAGNTDNTRPSFAQKGNTYRPLRNIIPDALNNFGTTNQYQYFGLATPFEVLAASVRIDLNFFEPLQISFLGEYAQNLAFDQSGINEVAVNNRGVVPLDESGIPTGVGDFEGGDVAWNAGLIVGKPVFEKAGDWNLSFGYRHVESDAVVDAFVDSDFAAGGTNVKGPTIGAAVALSPRVRLGFRYMSANQIAGPPLKSDVLLLDLSAKF